MTKYRVEAGYEGSFKEAAEVDELLKNIAERVPGFKVLRHSEWRERKAVSDQVEAPLGEQQVTT